MGIAKRKKVGHAITKSVLNYMADCASDDGTGIWVSKLNMAADLEVNATSVRRAIAALQEMGVVKEMGRVPRRAGGYTIDYSICIEAVEALESTREKAEGKTPDRAQGTTAVGPTARARSGHPPDKPPLEPPLEPSPSVDGDPPPDPGKKVRLPDGWVPSSREIEYAHHKHGLTFEEIDEIADDFRGYWHDRTDKDAKRTADGWRRTWQQRIRSVAPDYKRNRAREGRSGGPGSGRTAAFASVAQDLSRRKTEGF